MKANKEQLKSLQEIILDEYGVTLQEDELISEAIRISEFAKTVIRFSLSKKQ